RPVIGAYELIFVTFVNAHAPEENVPSRWFLLHSARVTVHAAGQARELGLAAPDAPAMVRQGPSNRQTTIELKISVQPHQLSDLENLRNGGGVDFHFAANGAGGKVGHARNEELEHGTL